MILPLLVTLMASAAPPVSCPLELLDAGAGGDLAIPSRLLRTAGFEVAHTAKASSPHATTEFFFAPDCEPRARQLAKLLTRSEAAARPLTWKSAYPLVIALGPASSADVALETAVKAKDISGVQAALAQGAAVHQLRAEKTLLDTAVFDGQTEIARRLLEAGARPLFGECPVSMASYNNQEDMVRMLLDHGMDPNEHNQEHTPAVMLAVNRQSMSLLKLLVEHGADLNAIHGNQGSVICLTGVETEFFAYLLQKHVDVNVRCFGGERLIHRAARDGTAEVLAQLLAAGADVNATDDDQRTALWNATPDSLPFLLTHGARVDVRDVTGTTPLHEASEVEVIKTLLARGIPVDAVDKDGVTPLHLLALYGNVEAVTALLAAGANVNARTTASILRSIPGIQCRDDPGCLEYPPGATPLDLARGASKKEVVALLKKKGGRVGVKPKKHRAEE